MKTCFNVGLVLILGFKFWVKGIETDAEQQADRFSKSRVNPKFVNKWLEEYREASGNEDPPKMYVEWIKLASAHNCSIRPMDYKAIFDDLRPFKLPGMTKKYITSISEIIQSYSRELLLLPKKDIPSLASRLPLHFGPALSLANDNILNAQSDFSMIINYSDEPMIIPSDDHSYEPYKNMADVFDRNININNSLEEYFDNVSQLSSPYSFSAIPLKYPVFSVSRIENFLDIIMPNHRSGLASVSDELKRSASNFSEWERKIPEAFFRGSSLGVNFKNILESGTDITSNSRFKLYEMAQLQRRGKLECSVKLNFAITKYLQYNADQMSLNQLKFMYPEVGNVAVEEQFKRKYIVVVDGNGWAERVALYMLSGSLIFLATIHEDWVSRQMVDGIHYIKVEPDLSDLIEKLEWAHNNDEEAKVVAQNGQKLASSRFDLKNLQIYNALLVMEYENLFYN